jgi:hypothetical protein
MQVQGKDIFAAHFKEPEKVPVIYDTVLDHLSQPIQELIFRELPENLAVNKYCLGLVKGPDQVLAFWDIDPCLAADRTVYLGQKGCRHLGKWDGAHIARCKKTGNITCHTSTQGKKAVLAIKTQTGQSAGQFCNCSEILTGFPARKDNHFCMDVAIAQRGQKPFAKHCSHIIISYYGVPFGKWILVQFVADFIQ